MIIGLIGYIFFQPAPQDSKFMTPEEKIWLLHELSNDRGGGLVAEDGMQIKSIVWPLY